MTDEILIDKSKLLELINKIGGHPGLFSDRNWKKILTSEIDEGTFDVVLVALNKDSIDRVSWYLDGENTVESIVKEMIRFADKQGFEYEGY